MAGFTNAAVVLTEGVAYATIAGLPPQYGLYTAMITPVIAALWGSSMIMISGPTTAISAVMFAALDGLAPVGTPAYISFALTLTIMVGLVQLAAGIARLGSLVSFVSHSVMIGFTAAAAVLIGVSQFSSALGLHVARGGSVFERVVNIANDLETTNFIALAIALATLVSGILLHKYARRLPGFLIAIIIGSMVGWALDASVHDIVMVGALPASLPTFVVPDTSFMTLRTLSSGAAAIALVGLLEAISVARAFAIKRGESLDSSQEMVGQGLSNVVGGFFQAYAGSGSFTRSGVNADSGAVSPLSAIFAAVFLAIILLLISPLAAYVPLPAIAGLILFVAWRLIDFQEIARFVTASRAEALILVATFATGVMTQLDYAIFVGVVASMSLFLYRSSKPALAPLAPIETAGHRHFNHAEILKLPECPQISALRLDGPLYFGSVEHAERELRRHEVRLPGQNTKILLLKGVGEIDLSGVDFLTKEINRARANGGDFHLVVAFPPLLENLKRLNVIEHLGEKNLHRSKHAAIAAAVDQADDNICRNCELRIFDECMGKSFPQ